MKIMFILNSWQYDVMIRSLPLWLENNVSIVYLVFNEKQMNYLKKIFPNIGTESYCYISKNISKMLNNVDITDKNIENLEKKYNCRYVEMAIGAINWFKYNGKCFDNRYSDENLKRYFSSAVYCCEKVLDKYNPD